MEWLASRGRGFTTPCRARPNRAGGGDLDLVPGGARRGAREGPGCRVTPPPGPPFPPPGGWERGGRAISPGRLGGPKGTSPRGLGSAVMRVGAIRWLRGGGGERHRDVLDARGEILAGARTPDGRWIGLLRHASWGTPPLRSFPAPGRPHHPLGGWPPTGPPLPGWISPPPMVAGWRGRRSPGGIVSVTPPFDGGPHLRVSTVEQEESISNPELLALGHGGAGHPGGGHRRKRCFVTPPLLGSPPLLGAQRTRCALLGAPVRWWPRPSTTSRSWWWTTGPPMAPSTCSGPSPAVDCPV